MKVNNDKLEVQIQDDLTGLNSWNIKVKVDKMSNTTVTIKYANGSTREFVASDKLEESINEGEMFSVTTMHSDMGIDEEMSVSKMYVGNPLTAMGNMIIMKRNAEMMPEDIEGGEHKAAIMDVLTACIGFMADEIASHQSGMSPVEGDQTGEDELHL